MCTKAAQIDKELRKVFLHTEQLLVEPQIEVIDEASDNHQSTVDPIFDGINQSEDEILELFENSKDELMEHEEGNETDFNFDNEGNDILDRYVFTN